MEEKHRNTRILLLKCSFAGSLYSCSLLAPMCGFQAFHIPCLHLACAAEAVPARTGWPSPNISGGCSRHGSFIANSAFTCAVRLDLSSGSLLGDYRQQPPKLAMASSAHRAKTAAPRGSKNAVHCTVWMCNGDLAGKPRRVRGNGDWLNNLVVARTFHCL